MMKKKEEKEVISLAKISFLKNGFFAAAFVMVMVMAVVVVLFAVSAAPVSAQQPVMNISFVDNTGGAYPPDQIYFAIIGRSESLGGNPKPLNNYGHVDKSGKLIVISESDNTVTVPGYTGKYANYCHKLSEVSEITVPQMYSGRVYISFGTPVYLQSHTPAAYACPTINNPNIPGFEGYWDKVEFTFDTTGGKPHFNCNPTQVDYVAIPLTIQLTTDDGVTSTKYGVTECRSAIFDAFKRDMPAKFRDDLTLQYPYRILAPYKGTQHANLSNYFDSYIDDVWEYYNSATHPTHKLDFTSEATSLTGQVKNGVFNFDDGTKVHKPTTKQVFQCSGDMASPAGKPLCGAFNRHMVRCTTDHQDWSSNTSEFYQSAPANYYAQFWHIHSIDHLAYGFPYDDVGGHQPTIDEHNPKELIITLSCWDEVGPANFTVNLSAHWNGLSLPLNDSSVTDAASLAAKIGVNCKEVLGWDSTKQKYVPYIPGKPFHNFDIKAGEGYMVNLKKPTPVVFTGKGWTSPFTIQLAQKYTALGAPVKDSSITKASSLATKIGGCKLISKYDGAKQKTVCYRPHDGDIPPPGDVCSSTEDFEITGGDAYFVYVPNPTKVTFVGVPWHN